MTEHKQIKVEVDGAVVAEAVVSTPDEEARARAEVHVDPGHLPTGTRAQVAAAVHEAVVADAGQHLTAALPRGDAELMEEMRDRLEHAELRSAGASSIIEGDVKQL